MLTRVILHQLNQVTETRKQLLVYQKHIIHFGLAWSANSKEMQVDLGKRSVHCAPKPAPG